MKNAARQNKKKSEIDIAYAARRAARQATREAPINPRLRPTLRIIIDAGILNNANPTAVNDIGKVANDGFGAIEEPIIPPRSTTIAGPAPARAWLALKIGMFFDWKKFLNIRDGHLRCLLMFPESGIKQTPQYDTI